MRWDMVGQAVTSITSPDNNRLLILTSSYNLLNTPTGTSAGQQISADCTEFVFIYDISKHTPVKRSLFRSPILISWGRRLKSLTL